MLMHSCGQLNKLNKNKAMHTNELTIMKVQEKFFEILMFLFFVCLVLLLFIKA